MRAMRHDFLRRKRHVLTAAYVYVEATSHHHHIMVTVPTGYSQTPPTLPGMPAPRDVLSGGRGDLGLLTMLEDSFKRLKLPSASLCAMLPRPHRAHARVPPCHAHTRAGVGVP
ncbi:hypothetical protein ZWY2020_033263 [Hordeum vulgare]|nr:hypothetical protein ZWY2020_033263 [Hordeum vulgare]